MKSRRLPLEKNFAEEAKARAQRDGGLGGNPSVSASGGRVAGLRSVICPIAAVDAFIQVAYEETTNLTEVCAILGGREQEDGNLLVTAVIVPK